MIYLQAGIEAEFLGIEWLDDFPLPLVGIFSQQTQMDVRVAIDQFVQPWSTEAFRRTPAQDNPAGNVWT